MKTIDILKFNFELIKRLKVNGIKLDDVQYIDLYTDYCAMQKDGDKVSYIVAVLANKYAVSERKVYSIIKKFKKDCTNYAV